MNNLRSKIQNFWFYYKKHLLIGLAVVLVAGYLMSQKSPEPDYHIGLVRAEPLPGEVLQELEARFTAAGTDVNGDGQVLVQIHTYCVNLADDGENAGVRNADAVQALDADLIGGMSGIFLLEDVQTFRAVTNGLVGDAAASMEYGLQLTLRKDADDSYLDLINRIS